VLKRIDHIGVIVQDLAKARAFLESLGMELDRELELPERSIRAAFYRCGDGQVEIIELTTGEAGRQRLGDGGRARIDHIAIEVDDLSQTMEAVRGLGVEIDSEGPVPVGRNLNVWTLAETSEGVRYQFLQKDAV
jgi:methylmalonyl-CoA/ethylmalonyl-CoA epimerase